MALSQIIGFGSTNVDSAKHLETAKTELLSAVFARFLPLHTRDNSAFRLRTDEAGRPYLEGRDVGSIQVSFSYCENSLWAVIANDTPIGIDVAAPHHFAGEYPWHRIFTSRERKLLTCMEESIQSSAAAIWACKEAAVKARGSGFSTISPLDVEMRGYTPMCNGFKCELVAPESYIAVVQRQDHLWRAIAGSEQANRQH